MYDVEDLEQKWRVYKSKKRTPWYIFIILELVVAIYYVNRIEVDNVVTTYMEDNNMSSLFTFDREKELVNLNEINSSAEDNKTDIKKVVDDPELKQEVEEEHKRKYLKIEVTDKYQNDQDDTVRLNDEDVIDFQTMKTLKSVKMDFVKSKNYEDSLFLAETYYDNAEYREAEKWALVTNNLNNEIEESWLIFVKSKVKMGETEEAMEVLNVYIKKTNSEAAKSLLLDIKQNKL